MIEEQKKVVGPSGLPSGERLHSNGKSPFLMGKSTINGHFPLLFVCSPEGITPQLQIHHPQQTQVSISGYKNHLIASPRHHKGTFLDCQHIVHDLKKLDMP